MISAAKLGSRLLILLLLAGLAVATAAGTLMPGRSLAAPIAARIDFPTVSCGGTTGTATLSWTPSIDATQQWLDLSIIDNGFAAGSFTGVNVGSASNTYTLPGLPASVAQFWRVNSFTADGWATSATGSFVPCGSPSALYSPVNCEGLTRASVDFRWAPIGAGGSQQWIDVGYDSGFGAGSFASAGPLQPTAQTYHWSALQSDTRTFFRVNELGLDGAWHTSTVGEFTAACAPHLNPDIYGSGDRLVSTRLGLNAPVNVRDVDGSGYLGDPAGPTDVVRYDFPLFAGYGGYPGSGGTTLLAGHLDYHNYGYAVFEPLTRAQVGDVFTYVRSDGTSINYVADWVSDLPPDYEWASLAINTSTDSLVLVTCNGTFNFTTREYDHRRVVHAVISNNSATPPH